ncbi:hypothetical protein, partial [Bartonella sp. OT172YNZD]|uniref:hypothetical protein n=1 Tax=Bartonella sp. OT172YNZD TaxID=3243572 RepID=UPI0035D0E073
MEAIDLLHSALSNDVISKISSCTSAKDIWDKLEYLYETNIVSSEVLVNNYFVEESIIATIDIKDVQKQDIANDESSILVPNMDTQMEMESN